MGGEDNNGGGRSKVRSGGKSGMNFVNILVPVVISAVLALIMVLQYAPTKSDVKDLKDKVTAVEGVSTMVTADSGRIDSIINSYATKASVTAQQTAIDEFKASINSRMDALDELSAEYANKADFDAFKVSLQGDVDILTTDLTTQINSAHSLDYTLVSAVTGGGYTLTVVSDKAGSYVGRLTLTYNDPISVGAAGATMEEALQAFYSGLNDPNRDYIPHLVYVPNIDPTLARWQAVEVTFNTSGFILVADTQASFALVINGLQGDFDDYDSIYVEVLPGAVVTTTTASGI
jgi:hypothetical protein